MIYWTAGTVEEARSCWLEVQMQDICSPSTTSKGHFETAVNFKCYAKFFFFSFLSYYFTCLNVQSLDKNCLGSLRKAYCGSLNLLLRREVNDHKSIITLSWSYCLFLVYFQNIYPCKGCTTKFQLLFSLSEGLDAMISCNPYGLSWVGWVSAPVNWFNIETFENWTYPSVVPSVSGLAWSCRVVSTFTFAAAKLQLHCPWMLEQFCLLCCTYPIFAPTGRVLSDRF